MREQMLVWVRVGDDGEYENFDDLDAACDYLTELQVGQVAGWVSYGFETDEFWGQDYISMYWGDRQGDAIRELDEWEQDYVEEGIYETAN